MTMLKSVYHRPQARCLYHAIAKCGCNALMVLGTLVMGPGRAFALDGSNTNAQRNIATTHFASGRQALQAGLDNLKAGNMEASVAALTYAAANGQPLARWKLGEMYAKGDGVPRDDFKAYHYFDQLVEDYDEDQSDPQDLSAFSSAFVAVGVYCLSGIPNSDVRPDPRRAHELFQYAATTFGDPNAQYNLARMYMVGAGSLAKDDIAAIRWLALAAKQGHPPSQALLGHMLFMGDGVLDQRARRRGNFSELFSPRRGVSRARDVVDHVESDQACEKSTTNRGGSLPDCDDRIKDHPAYCPASIALSAPNTALS
jgi:uncharacterized protein